MIAHLRPHIFIGPREIPIDVGHEFNLSNVATPSEVTQEDGCFIKSYLVNMNDRFSTLDVELLVAKYYPAESLKMGFDRFYMMDKKTNKLVVMNDLIVDYIRSEHSNSFNGLVSIDKEHRFKGIFGHLTYSCIFDISIIFFNVYGIWKDFPNAKSMDSVLAMLKIMDDATDLIRNIERVESDIKDYKKNIEEIKGWLRDAESSLNREYERLASDMEELESMGYKFDFNKVRKLSHKNTDLDTFSIGSQFISNYHINKNYNSYYSN